MDFINKLTGSDNAQDQNETQTQQSKGQSPSPSPSHSKSQDQKSDTEAGESGGILSSISTKLNTAVGGGKESEKNEDALDKAIDLIQDKVLAQGPQDDESALEQAKDEQVSDFIRAQYEKGTGREFPVGDKKRFG